MKKSIVEKTCGPPKPTSPAASQHSNSASQGNQHCMDERQPSAGREPGKLDEIRGCGAVGKQRSGAAGDNRLQPLREGAREEEYVIEV